MKNPKDETYKILRDRYVAFVLKESENGCEFITVPVGMTDKEALELARSMPSGEWRKVETIRFDSIQSKAVPEPDNQSE